MAVSGIQGLPLEVTVVGCINLKDKEWISRQDPFVSLEYGSNRFRTKTCTDGGKNPSFQEKFVVSLIEGLHEVKVGVWNSNTLSADDFIGSGRIQLNKVLSQGYDDSSWSVQDKCGRSSGEVRLILHYNCGNPSKNKISPSAPPATYLSAPPAAYPTYPAASPCPGYPPISVAPTCPPPPYSAYPPTAAVYPPNTTYPPPTYPPPPSGYPTSTYPPPPVMYPPQYPPPPTACYPPPPGSFYPPPPY